MGAINPSGWEGASEPGSNTRASQIHHGASGARKTPKWGLCLSLFAKGLPEQALCQGMG